MRLAFVTPGNLGPYHLARFDALAASDVSLTVVRIPSPEYFRPWQPQGGNGHYRLVPPLSRGLSPEMMTSADVRRLLDRFDPHVVVVVGYGGSHYYAAAHWARTHAVPCVLAGDSWKKSNTRHLVKEFAKSLLVRLMYDGAFVAGHRSAQYFKSLGLPARRIWRGYDVVNNRVFRAGAAHARRQEARTRSDFNLPDDYFLYCGRLSPEKNLLRLIDAFHHYRVSGGPWHLVIVGSGPYEQKTRARAAREGDSIHFVPWVQRERLPAVYGLARCLVLPSLRETWGLVANEGMATGLPVLISRGCGCQPDLCWRGINGYDFAPKDVEALSGLMLKMSSDAVDLERMGKASLRIVSNFTPQTWAAALIDCAETLRGS
jgi:glycosyltransferase involved in cell wall biosynthesis